MTLKITIKMDNAAFEENSGAECARMLQLLANYIDERDILPGEAGFMLDINGNKAGKWAAQ